MPTAQRTCMAAFSVVMIFASFLPPSIASAKMQRIECQSEVPETSVQLTKTPASWTPFVAAPLYLHSVAPTDGPPEVLGQLKGETKRTAHDSWVDTYSLEGPFPQGKWLSCQYGMLNEVVLSKRLDDSTRRCTVAGKKGEKAGQNVFVVQCE